MEANVVAFKIAAKHIGTSSTGNDCRANYWLITAIRFFHVSKAKVQKNVPLQLQQMTLFIMVNSNH